MKKKVVVFFIFLSFFFIKPQPIYAAEGNFFTIFWTWITNNLSWLLHEDTVRYTSNELPLTIDKSENFTKYTDINNSLSDRSTPESVRAYRRGLLFYEILNETKGPSRIKYEDKIIKTNGTDGCNKDFKTTDIICFYYQKYINNQSTKKILYTRDDPNKPIDYPEILSEKCNKTLPNPDNCYINAYINYQDIPTGNFSGETNAAVISSNQFNESISTPLPDLDQGEDPPTNDTQDKVKILAKNSDEKEQLSLLNLITNENRNNIPCISNNEEENRQYLRIFRDKGLVPAKWGTLFKLPEPASSIEKPELPNHDCEKKGHGRGMSQFGALGMAMSGYDYHQILNSYYGTNNPSDPNYTGITFETKNEYENANVTVNLTGSCDDNIDCSEGKYSSCVNINNSNPSRFDLKKINHPKDYVELKNYKCTESDSDHEKEKEEFNNWWDKSCTYQITLSLDDYLLGLAEIFVSWHLETHKALIVAARNIAYIKSGGFNSPLVNTSAHQIFRCRTLSGNMGKPNNHNTAVAMTKNEFMTVNGQIATTEYSSIHCDVSQDWAHFDGTAFEQVGLQVFGIGVGNIYDGVCYTNDSYPITTTSSNGGGGGGSPGITITGSEINGLFHFNDTRTRPDHRIGVDYDIANVQGGKWLQTFSGSCRLDNRTFPGLQQLIDVINKEVPGNSIKLNSCYRSIAEQTTLWVKALNKYNNNESEASKHVARPGQSPHHTGRAIDFGDNGGKLNENSSIYRWLVQNGSRFGFYNYKPEPWHWEYNP